MSTAPRERGEAGSAVYTAELSRALGLGYEQLYRLTRDSRRQIWRPAVCALAWRAQEEPEAYRRLRDLLISPLPELRMRGVVALGAVAPVSPEVEDFLMERLGEEETLADALLLDSLLETAARLPAPRDSLFQEQTLMHADARVRAAAVSLLREPQSLAKELLARLCRDPEASVRGALALRLTPEVTQSGLFELVTTLAQDEQAEVRAAVAASLKGDSSQARFLRMSLESDPVPAVRAALRARVPGSLASAPEFDMAALPAVLEVESQLDSAPQRAFSVLRPWLGRADTLELLLSLAEMCRSQETGALLRSLHVLLASSEDDQVTRWLRGLGILAEVQEDSAAGEWRSLLAAALEILEAETLEDLLGWSLALQVPRARALDPAAWKVLSRLAGHLRKLGLHPGLSVLSKACSNVEALVQEAEGCLRPEAEILAPGLERAVTILGQQMNHLMAGADS